MTDPAPADLSAIVKAYDVRGDATTQLTPDVAHALGAAFADFLRSSTDGVDMIVAHDMRVSSPDLARAFIDGAVRRGATVADAGLSSTDQLYCASGLHRAAGGMITASHNPAKDNGLKLCLPGARPISRDTGLAQMRATAEGYLDAGQVPEVPGGASQELDTLRDYVDTVLGLVPISSGRRLRVVVDAANAMGGHTVPAVFERLDQIDLVPLHFELDGTFPNHPADPLNPENLHDLRAAVLKEGADLGFAFDGDADRCVVLDERGALVPPSAITALIAQREIARVRGAGEDRPAVVANLVSSRHVAETIAASGGEHVRSKVGHSLIKALMAEHSAVFGGEHSAHYYFRDFFHADSGMLAALHVLAALAETEGSLSQLVAAHDPYASSGEINSRVADAELAREAVRAHIETVPGTTSDELDGLTVEHWDPAAPEEDRWWFSLRSSNTEPLLRLNVEAAQQSTMERVRDEILDLIRDQAPGTGVGDEPAHSTPATQTEPSIAPAGASGADVPGWVRERLCCPDCAGSLRDVDGGLQCTSCARTHAVDGGIPVLIAGRTEAPGADQRP